MLELFQVEVEGQAATLSDGLLRLEKEPASPQLLESLMRAAHSIKGAARLVGVDAATELAHVMEDCFVAAQGGKLTLGAEAIDVLLKGVDTLTQIGRLSPEEHAHWPTQHRETLERLGEALRKVLAGEPLPAPPGGGGGTDPAAGANDSEAGRAAGVDASMLELFRVEVENQAGTLATGLGEAKEGSLSSNTLEALVRAAHSIRGAARLVGLDAAAELARAAEQRLSAAQQGERGLDQQAVDGLLQAVEVLRSIAALDAGEQSQWLQQERARVQAVAGALTAATEQQSPEPAADTRRPAPPSEPAQDKARVLRISADRVNRLMGLAGEFTVSSRWLRHYADSMLGLKKHQTDLIATVDRLRAVLEEHHISELAHSLLSDLQNTADEFRQHLGDRLTDLEDFDRRANNLTGRLNHEVIATRMRPFGDGVHGFQRMVRDVARSMGKRVELQIGGLDTQVDRDILEMTEAPLNHILRNAVDHGIESPEDRKRQGKPESGTIRMEATHSAGMLSIMIADDGRGVDLDALKKRIVDKEMVSPAMAEELSESELLDFLFLPSFSTRDQVTEISGRGVGLDVVHSVVQEMRGQVRASTKPGKGLRIQLQLPLTLSVIRSLLTRIGGELYAFPLGRIDSVLRVARDQIETIEDRQYITHEGRHIGLVEGAQVLGRQTAPCDNDTLSVAILSDRQHAYGVAVEEFLGERDLAVHTLDPRLGKIKDISAGAVTEDGTPLLIVDVDDMLRSIENLASGKRLHKVSGAVSEERRGARRVLIVDDSLTVREVERKLLESRGYEVDVAVDGMDGWNTVRVAQYDLVISDIDMPRMNGIEFVGLIKNDPRLCSMPVMIVSYKDRQEDRDRGLEAGADYYLAKGSFHDDTLIDAVVDLIGEAHQ